MGITIAAGSRKQDIAWAQGKQAELARALKESRKRCLAAGLDAAMREFPDVSQQGIDIARKNVFGGIAYARKSNLGYLKSLTDFIGSMGGAAYFLDHSLHVCGIRGNQETRELLAAANVKFGTDFSEANIGTNAGALCRDIMCGCRLDPQENFAEIFQDFVTFAQGPIKIGLDDFIIAFAAIPKRNVSQQDIAALEHAFLALGIISQRNEVLHADASNALLEKLMGKRGLSFIMLDKHERIVHIGEAFLDALGLQGRATVGTRVRESIPQLSPVLDACEPMPEESLEVRVEGFEIEGFPAWAIATKIPLEDSALLGITVKSGAFRSSQPDAAHSTVSIESFAGASACARQLRARMHAIARKDGNALIVGASGTGKGTAARAIHNASARRLAPFITCDCALLSEINAFETLFGTPEKAGLFQQARGGTLFLDGVAEMPLRAQALLGRVLESDDVTLPGIADFEQGSVRIMLATDQNPAELLRTGLLQTDFYYRMPAIVLEMPSLNNHSEDIPAIACALAKNYLESQPETKSATPLREEDFAILTRETWNGNVRELKKAIERAFIEAELADTPLTRIGAAVASYHESTAPDLKSKAPLAAPPASCEAPSRQEIPSYAEHERRELADALIRNKGNKSATAHELGITRKTLYLRLKKHGIIE